MRAISYSEVRNNLATVLDQVVDDSDATIITRRGDQGGDRAVVLMPLTEYNSWMETVHLLRGRNHARLMRAIEQDKSSQAVKRNLVDG